MFLFGQILLTVVAASLAVDCPPRDKVYPCSCENDGLLTSVDCEGFSSLSKVEPVVKNTLGHNVSFAFWRSNLGDIPSEFFKGHQSVNLHFENCKIGSFGDKPFSGLENSLRQLYIYGSVDKRRKDLKTFPLSHLKHLRDVSFLGNDIVQLGNDWFEDGPEALEQLDLQANDIEKLGDKAFTTLTNLQQLWLGDNRVRTVSRSMFPNPANKLWLIEISFNGIEELPADFFEGFPALKTVNLAGNKLKTIPESIWGKVWSQLEEVYVERNQGFVCDESLKWIYRQKLPKILRGKCGYGNNLYNRDLDTLKLEDFQ
ncbi:toll-like receptor 13 [Parasteatoda tepidariorum]|uniref:toll-like receptor 13 n=1 Tax=Parasteatoda tepidariorum TaxID=114398 RepID=UPI001C727570|nr:leucine-rich repeat and transmembrane domain-containing protein 2-like [Parasteatoda tepidariorum]